MDRAIAVRLMERFGAGSAEMRRAFYERMRSEGITPAQLPMLPRAAGTVDGEGARVEPLSPAQDRQWFLWNLDRSGTAYHISAGLTLSGELDAGAVQASLHALVQRHEALRTVFRVDEHGQAWQHIQPNGVSFNLQRGQPSDEAGLVDTPFDLTQGPLLRAGLIALGPREHRLIVVMHHIVSDGWSMAILVREFAQLYRAHALGEPAVLPDLPLQYADYAAWQRHWLQAGEQDRQLNYWREQLPAPHPVLQLQTDHPRRAGTTSRAAHHTLELPTGLVQALQQRMQRQHGTLFMALLAGLQALLHRHSGQADLRIGVPVANRQRAEVENIVGFFVNTQVLPARLHGRLTLQALLEQTRHAALQAQAHQDLPFEQLVQALQPERSLDTPPLFQVLFNHQREEASPLQQLPGLTLQPLELHDPDAQFELSLDTTETPDGGVQAIFSYAQDLFEPGTVERLAGHYLRLLEALAHQPEQALGDVLLFDDSEKHELQQYGHNPERHVTAEPVHRLIERQAQARPDAIALMLDDEQLSYAQLDQQANRLAHRLRREGVGPDVRVGLATERSTAMVVALLAILKAGGAYVPLDASLPTERLRYLMQDSRITQLITQSHIRGQLPQSTLPVLELDTLDLSAEPAQPPDVSTHPANLAYVIYTSGSTGQPKGIGIAHAQLAEHSHIAIGYFGLTAEDRMLQFSTLNFDGFVEQLFPPLVAGATVVLRGPQLWDSDTFHRQLLKQRITIADLPTAYWHLLAQDFARQQHTSYGALRQVQATGEAMPADGVRAWREAGLGHVKLLNTYGPTETVVTATAQDCSAWQAGPVPIGHPLAGRTLHVLDAELNPVPLGAAGELFIGGDLLARGYVERPTLSAERFIADPFGEAGARLYRTGDVARWNTAGQLEYLGRVDHQVKLRGLRVELAEIEAQLLKQPGVREAVVVAQPNPAGLMLVGYVGADAQLDTPELQAALSRELPSYMVPSRLIVLAQLPKNPSGKIDRHALPKAEAQGTSHEAPQGEAEEALARIWREVLGTEQVSRGDHFFASGGHSIAALRMVSRVLAELGVELPLRQVFETPVLAPLAARVAALRQQGRAAALVPVPRQPQMRLSPAQQRLWLVEHMAAAWNPDSRSAYNIAAGLRLTGALDADVLRQALAFVVQRHEVLRTAYPASADGEPVAVIHADVPLDFAVRDLCGDAVDAALAVLAAKPFNLGQAPLLRAELLRLSPHEHVLLLCVHHLVFDGWSEAVFVREFTAAYAALRNGTPPALAPLRIQFADHADWQARRLDAQGEAHRAFWRDTLAGAPEVSTWPADFSRPTLASSDGDAVAVQLPRALADQLGAVARRAGCSLFTVLFAAFALQLHRQAGADDAVIGTDAAGRDHPLAEGLIGFFVNVVPLRSRIDASSTFTQWLRRLHDTVLAALDHQALPFDQIVEQVQLRRDRQRNPLVQTLFVMQNVPQDRLVLPGLDIEPLPQPTRSSKFDLAVFAAEGPEGLSVDWTYSTRLYRRDTIEQASRGWCELVAQIAADPEAPMARLVSPPLQELPPMQGTAPRLNKLDKLKKVIGKATAAPAAAIVRTAFLPGAPGFPRVFDASHTGVDAVAWARGHKAEVEATLQTHAGLLFRGFGLVTPADFEAFAEIFEPGLYGGYGDLPKKEGARNLYRSTPYPEQQMILFHNESAHLERWPRKQWFFCEEPSPVGGATPIVDCREMLRRLPAALVERFERLGLLYVRTFVPRLDVGWRDFFKTDSAAEVEARLRQAGTAWRWLDADTLQTRSRGPAVIAHPFTGERVFFNQVQLHHTHCLDDAVRADLLAMVGADSMPRQVFYGDGSTIDDDTMRLVGEAYEACAVRFAWQRGDVVMLDNMRAAHARDPYQGPRKIVVAMGAMFDRDQLQPPAGQRSQDPAETADAAA